MTLVDPLTHQVSSLVTNDSVGWMFDPVCSRNGDRVAVSWNRYADSQKNRVPGIWVIGINDSVFAQKMVIRGEQLAPLMWSPDSEWLYFCSRRMAIDKICRVRLADSYVDTVLKVPFDRFSGLSMVDSTSAIVDVSESKSDIRIVENFDPGAE